MNPEQAEQVVTYLSYITGAVLVILALVTALVAMAVIWYWQDMNDDEEKTMSDAKQTKAALAEYQETADGIALELKLNLGGIVRAAIGANGGTIESARRSGLTFNQFADVLHAKRNCTLDEVGRLLHALGMRGMLLEVRDGRPVITEAHSEQLKCPFSRSEPEL